VQIRRGARTTPSADTNAPTAALPGPKVEKDYCSTRPSSENKTADTSGRVFLGRSTRTEELARRRYFQTPGTSSKIWTRSRWPQVLHFSRSPASIRRVLTIPSNIAKSHGSGDRLNCGPHSIVPSAGAFSMPTGRATAGGPECRGWREPYDRVPGTALRVLRPLRTPMAYLS